MMRFLLGALVVVGALTAQQAPAPAAKAQEPAKPAYEQRAAIYPLTTCVVSGEELGADAVTFTADGTTFRTCCEKCQKKVEADVAAFRGKVAEASMKMQSVHYFVRTCPVSNKKLGSMGDPVPVMLDGTLVKLCCSSCTKKAEANAAAIKSLVMAATYREQRALYPVDTCLVSGEKLGDDAKDVMFGTVLVRFCCEKCVDGFGKDEHKHFATLRAAWEKKFGRPKQPTGGQPVEPAKDK